MHTRSGIRFVAVLAIVSLVAIQGAAQEKFVPQSGQAGKDVVWVPTPQELVNTMLDMAKVTKDDFLWDLGSGDGRTVITAAQRGARARGIEYNPKMVQLSRENAAAAKPPVGNRAEFVEADLFATDFSQATVVTMFLLPSINMRLRPQILNMKPGTRIVANTFTMDDWQEDEKRVLPDPCISWCTALLWYVPAKVDGPWKLPQGTLTIAQRFQNFTGTLGNTTISDGKLRGDEISFTAGAVKYAGKVNGNTITGTANGQPFTATKG